jgi:hypothetical protein
VIVEIEATRAAEKAPPPTLDMGRKSKKGQGNKNHRFRQQHVHQNKNNKGKKFQRFWIEDCPDTKIVEGQTYGMQVDITRVELTDDYSQAPKLAVALNRDGPGDDNENDDDDDDDDEDDDDGSGKESSSNPKPAAATPIDAKAQDKEQDIAPEKCTRDEEEESGQPDGLTEKKITPANDMADFTTEDGKKRKNMVDSPQSTKESPGNDDTKKQKIETVSGEGGDALDPPAPREATTDDSALVRIKRTKSAKGPLKKVRNPGNGVS